MSVRLDHALLKFDFTRNHKIDAKNVCNLRHFSSLEKLLRKTFATNLQKLAIIVKNNRKF